jgi:hypothetical protein
VIVSVSGACSRSGKTAAAVALVEALPRHSALAVKFTTTEETFVRCPRGKPCVVCDIDVPFRLVEDPAVLREPGTDTDRLAAAGARRVVWAIAKAGAVPEAWKAVCERMDGGPVVMEGSTIVGLARPDVQVFVAHPFLLPERWKPTTPALVESADLVVVNCPAGERRQPSASVLAALARHRAGREVRMADVARPLAEWAPEILDRLSPVMA